MKITPEQLRTELANHYGSEKLFFHNLNRNVHYTEGVQAMAQLAGAYWLLDILATEPAILEQQKEFAAIKLQVGDNVADLVVTDGNDNHVFSRTFTYTDFPQGKWMLYFIDGTILLPSEY